MRKKIRIVVFSLVGVMGAIFFGGYLLDKNVEIETSTVIAAPVARVHQQVSTLDGLKGMWGAVAHDPDVPNMSIVHTGGPKAGTGMKLAFVAGDQTMEEWTVTESSEGRVRYDVDFKVFVAKRTLSFSTSETPEGMPATGVKWRETAELNNPLFRWLTVIMPEDATRKNFDAALLALKNVVEADS